MPSHGYVRKRLMHNITIFWIQRDQWTIHHFNMSFATVIVITTEDNIHVSFEWLSENEWAINKRSRRYKFSLISIPVHLHFVVFFRHVLCYSPPLVILIFLFILRSKWHCDLLLYPLFLLLVAISSLSSLSPSNFVVHFRYLCFCLTNFQIKLYFKESKTYARSHFIDERHNSQRLSKHYFFGLMIIPYKSTSITLNQYDIW